jgi:hypothetical protein
MIVPNAKIRVGAVNKYDRNAHALFGKLEIEAVQAKGFGVGHLANIN